MDLKHYLRTKLKRVPEDWAKSAWVVEAAAVCHALPLTADWGGYWGLREDGSVVFVDYEDPLAWKLEMNPRWRNVALFRGSLRYLELSELVPERGVEDVTCPDCMGSGRLPIAERLELDNLICGCGGLGWVPGNNPWDEVPRSEAAREDPRGPKWFGALLRRLGWK